MVQLLKILCRGVPWVSWGAVGLRSWGYMVNIHTFWCCGCQKLLILVLWVVQIVNVNLNDTFDGKTTFIWCHGVPWVSWGAVVCSGVIW